MIPSPSPTITNIISIHFVLLLAFEISDGRRYRRISVKVMISHVGPAPWINKRFFFHLKEIPLLCE